jgi:hypothetical protein
VDPLKPFGSTIRSIWDKTVRRTEHREKAVSTTATGDNQQTPTVVGASQVQPLHARLRARIPANIDWDTAQARTVFVESVLLSELGDDLANDSSFTQVVKNVSQQLGSDPKLSARLDLLLKQLSQGREVQ